MSNPLTHLSCRGQCSECKNSNYFCEHFQTLFSKIYRLHSLNDVERLTDWLFWMLNVTWVGKFPLIGVVFGRLLLCVHWYGKGMTKLKLKRYRGVWRLSENNTEAIPVVVSRASRLTHSHNVSAYKQTQPFVGILVIGSIELARISKKTHCTYNILCTHICY